MAKEMQQGEKLEGDDDDEGEGEDLGASVARWMSEQDGTLGSRGNSVHAAG